MGVASKQECYAVELEGSLIGCVSLSVSDFVETVTLSRADPSEDWDDHMNRFFEENPASMLQEKDKIISVNGLSMEGDESGCEAEFLSPGLTLVLKIERPRVETGKEAVLSFWLGQDYWNHGFATEACGRLLQHGFENLGVELVHGSYLADNRAAARVLTKLGFEGTAEESKFFFSRKETLTVVAQTLPSSLWKARHTTS